MDTLLDFTTIQVVGTLLTMAALLLAGIMLIRLYLNRVSDMSIAANDSKKAGNSIVKARTKYPHVDVSTYRPVAMLVGIVCGLILTTVLMNWTVSYQVQESILPSHSLEIEVEVSPPQTMEPPPPPPPPPPPTVIEVPDNIPDDAEESIEFKDQSIEAETLLDLPDVVDIEKPKEFVPPPPPPPIKEEIDEIFKVVEEMPRFPGCENQNLNANDKRICAERALYMFINEHLNYPVTARENNIHGNVVVQFVVNKDGSVQDVTILRDIGAGCGAEVVRVVNLMNELNMRWSPGKQRGTPVRVMFVLPVRFTLIVN